MKLTTISILLFAGMSIPFVAHADEEPAKNGSKKTQTVQVLVQSSSEKKDDAAPKITVKGQIVIVGPDGKRQEYDLSESLSDGVKINLGDVPHLHGYVHADGSEQRHMIGIRCEPASNLLRGHLKLTDQGLVASHVSEGLPAAEAGIQKDDILLTVGEQKLNSVPDLMNAVSVSEGKEVTVEVLRDGDRISVAVTPRKLTGKELKHVLAPVNFIPRHEAGSDGNEIAGVLSEIRHITGDKESPHVFLRRIGPGIRLGHSSGPHQEQQILHLIERMAEQHDSAASQADVDVDVEVVAGAKAEAKHHELTLKVLRQQVEQLQKQMVAIEKQLGNSDAE